MQHDHRLRHLGPFLPGDLRPQRDLPVPEVLQHHRRLPERHHDLLCRLGGRRKHLLLQCLRAGLALAHPTHKWPVLLRALHRAGNERRRVLAGGKSAGDGGSLPARGRGEQRRRLLRRPGRWWSRPALPHGFDLCRGGWRLRLYPPLRFQFQRRPRWRRPELRRGNHLRPGAQRVLRFRAVLDELQRIRDVCGLVALRRGQPHAERLLPLAQELSICRW